MKPVLERLSEIIDSLPEDSPTRGNLLCVRAAMTLGDNEERLLLSVLVGFAEKRLKAARGASAIYPSLKQRLT